jgi:hypothetical protein
MDEIMASPEYLDSLRQYMIKNLSVENLNFYEAVQNYKRAHALPPTPQKDGFLRELARTLFHQYVRKGAPEEVNIDGRDKDGIMENLGAWYLGDCSYKLIYFAARWCTCHSLRYSGTLGPPIAQNGHLAKVFYL